MNNKAQAIFFGYFTAFRKHLADYHDLQIVGAYQIFHLLILPIYWQRVILLYNPEEHKYYEFNSHILEERLAKLKDESSPEDYLKTIKEFEIEQKRKLEYLELHKKRDRKKENDDFLKFIKIAGRVILLIFLFIIIKWIITGSIY